MKGSRTRENSVAVKGVIFDIQRFSLHDGPGIRTTVFLKGCPLRCFWCHNPESQESHLEIAFQVAKCVRCGECQRVCPEHAVSLDYPHRVHRERCTLCGLCVSFCPTGALEIIGREVTVTEVVQVVERDTLFYEESEGGVTISGGEPLVQFPFTLALVSALKERRFHVAVDTAGYSGEKNDDYKKLETLARRADLLLYDVKLIDRAKHKYYVGVDNQVILHHVRRLFSLFSQKILLRYPLIPGINDTPRDIELLIDFLRDFPGGVVELLPYHRLGVNKYLRLGKTCELAGVLPFPEEKKHRIRQQIEKALPSLRVR